MNIETFEQLRNLRIETYKMLKRSMSDPVAVEWASDCLAVHMEVKGGTIMEKIYEGNNIYVTLCYNVGQDVIMHYWPDCLLSMQEIMEKRQEGETKFIVVFRRLGAELFPRNEGISARFSFYKREEPESRVFLLDYILKRAYSVSWEEAEEVLAK